MNNQIIVAGSLILDRHYSISSYPEEGRLVRIDGENDDVGGTGNIIIDLAKLDKNLTVNVSAVLGTGSAGRVILKKLAEYPNIETSAIVYKGHTSMTLVMDAADNHQRTFFYFPGASNVFCDKYINWEKLNCRKGDIFQLEYLLLMEALDAKDREFGTNAARILYTAQQKGMKTSIDMVSEKSERVPKIVKPALKYTDFCIINELEAQEVTGITLVDESGNIVLENRKAVLHSLADCGISEWIIIHAPSGSFGFDVKNNCAFSLPNLELPEGFIKGKTGAGDAFSAGVLYAAIKNQNIKQAMIYGTACAAISLSELNGTDGLRTIDEVLAMYKKYCKSSSFESL